MQQTKTLFFLFKRNSSSLKVFVSLSLRFQIHKPFFKRKFRKKNKINKRSFRSRFFCFLHREINKKEKLNARKCNQVTLLTGPNHQRCESTSHTSTSVETTRDQQGLGNYFPERLITVRIFKKVNNHKFKLLFKKRTTCSRVVFITSS